MEPQRCAKKGCTEMYMPHRWGRARAKGWFFQRSDISWCPDHIPTWVATWRANKSKEK